MSFVQNNKLNLEQQGFDLVRECDQFSEMTGNVINYISKKKTRNLSKCLYEKIFFAALYLANAGEYIRKSFEKIIGNMPYNSIVTVQIPGYDTLSFPSSRSMPKKKEAEVSASVVALAALKPMLADMDRGVVCVDHMEGLCGQAASNPKGELQELLSKHGCPLPQYKTENLYTALEKGEISYDIANRLVSDLSKEGTQGRDNMRIRGVIEKILVGLGKYSKEILLSSRCSNPYYCLTEEGYNFIQESLFLGACKISKELGKAWFTAHTTPIVAMPDEDDRKMESLYPCTFPVKGSSFTLDIDERTGMVIYANFEAKMFPDGENTRFMVMDEKLMITCGEKNSDRILIWFSEFYYDQWFGFKVVASIWEELVGKEKITNKVLGEGTYCIYKTERWENPICYKDEKLIIPDIIKSTADRNRVKNCLEKYIEDGLLYTPWGCYKIDIDNMIDKMTNPPYYIGERVLACSHTKAST